MANIHETLLFRNLARRQGELERQRLEDERMGQAAEQIGAQRHEGIMRQLKEDKAQAQLMGQLSELTGEPAPRVEGGRLREMAGVGARQAQASEEEARRAAAAKLGLQEAEQAGGRELQKLKTTGRLTEREMIEAGLMERAKMRGGLERWKTRQLFGPRGKNKRAELLTYLQRLQQQHEALRKTFDITGAQTIAREHERVRQIYESLYGPATSAQTQVLPQSPGGEVAGPPTTPGVTGEGALPSVDEWTLETIRRQAGGQ